MTTSGSAFLDKDGRSRVSSGVRTGGEFTIAQQLEAFLARRNGNNLPDYESGPEAQLQAVFGETFADKVEARLNRLDADADADRSRTLKDMVTRELLRDGYDPHEDQELFQLANEWAQFQADNAATEPEVTVTAIDGVVVAEHRHIDISGQKPDVMAKAKLAAASTLAEQATHEVREASVVALHELLNEKFPTWVSVEFRRDYDTGDQFSELYSVSAGPSPSEVLWSADDSGPDGWQLKANDVAYNFATDIGDYLDETVYEDDAQIDILRRIAEDEARASEEEMAFERRIQDEGR